MTAASRPPEPHEPPVRAAQAAALALLLALAVLCVAWELWWAPTGRGTLALKALPLLPFVPGMLRHRLSSFRALSLLLWLYVTEGLVRSTTEGGLSQALAAGEVALALLLFAAGVAYIRLRGAHAAVAA